MMPYTNVPAAENYIIFGERILYYMTDSRICCAVLFDRTPDLLHRIYPKDQKIGACALQ